MSEPERQPLADLLSPKEPRQSRPGTGLLVAGIAGALGLVGLAGLALSTTAPPAGPQGANVGAGPPSLPTTTPPTLTAAYDRIEPISTVLFEVPGAHELRRPTVHEGTRRVAFETVDLAASITLQQASWLGGEPVGTPRDLVGGLQRVGGPSHQTRGLAMTAGGQSAVEVAGPGVPSYLLVGGWKPQALPGAGAQDVVWDPLNPRFVVSALGSASRDLYLWDSGPPMQLTFDKSADDVEPAWSPDGGMIAFARRGEASTSIQALDVASSTSTTLVRTTGEHHSQPGFSPDGQSVAFFSTHGALPGSSALWSTPSVPRAPPQRIARGANAPSAGPAPWTPDGRYLLASLARPGEPLCFLPVALGRPVCIGEGGIDEQRDPVLLVDGPVWRIVAAARPAGGDRNHLVVYTIDPI